MLIYIKLIDKSKHQFDVDINSSVLLLHLWTFTPLDI